MRVSPAIKYRFIRRDNAYTAQGDKHFWIDVTSGGKNYTKMSADFIEGKKQEHEAREEMLRAALEEQLKRSNNADHALPIERLMDRLSAGKALGDEEYAAITEEIRRIQARTLDHLAKLEDMLDDRVKN